MAVREYPQGTQIRPGVTVTTNTDALSGVAVDSDKALMLLGRASSGKPQTVYEITSYQQAKGIFRGGELLDAIEAALSPSTAISGGTILAERVGNATQSTFTNGGLTLTSKMYSSDANKIQTSLTQTTFNNTYSLQVVLADDAYQQTYTNLGPIFGISYNGSQPYASVSVDTSSSTDMDLSHDDKNLATHDNAIVMGQDADSKCANKLILKVGADNKSAAEVATFVLGTGKYTKVNSLVAAINGIDGFSASYYPSGTKNIETIYLDALVETQLPVIMPGNTTTQPLYLTSLGGDVANVLSNYDDLLEAVYDPSKGEPTPYAITSLAGGTSPQVLPSSWSTEISQFADEDGYFLCPLTSDIAIQAEALAFCEDRVSVGDPCALLVGGGVKETITATINRAASLETTNAKVLVNATSATRLMADGTVKNLPGYTIAAMIGGVASGIDIGQSIIHKDLDLVAVDQRFTSSQLDALASAGAVAVEFVRNRGIQEFRITDDITTASPESSDPTVSELSVGESTDFLVGDLRQLLDRQYIGSPTLLTSPGDIKATISSFLLSKENNGEIEDYEENGITVTIIGNTVHITMQVVPVRAIKYITVGLNYISKEISA